MPRHDGGDNSPENLTPPISTRLHAMFHYDRWKVLGQIGDYLAWRVLIGRMSMSEAEHLAWLENVIKANEARAGEPAWNKGKKTSEETKAKISKTKVGTPAWNKGIPQTEEARAKMSVAHLLPEVRERHRLSRVGIDNCPRTEEYKLKMSLAKLGTKMPAEAIEKSRIARTGKKRSTEQRANMSEGQRKYWSSEENRRKHSERMKLWYETTQRKIKK